MALKTNFYLNGVKITEPLNYKELSIELNFDKDDPAYRGQVSTNDWTFGLGDKNDNNDASRIINKYINDGLVGGYGIFDGIPFRIELQQNNQVENLFDGYLDLPNGNFLCNEINAKSVETGKIDWLNDVADSFTFEYLENIGVITKRDYILIPYQINEQTNRYETAILLITAFTIVNELINIISIIKSVITALIFDPLQWGNIAAAISLLIRIVIFVIQINIFFKYLFSYVLQPIRYKAGMYLHDLCRIGASYLGLDFRSTILDGSNPKYTVNGAGFNHVALIPNDFNQYEDENGIFGITKRRDAIKELNGFYRGTFGDLLRELKNMFNGKIIIEDNPNGGLPILRLERIDYSNNLSPYKIPNIDKSESPLKYNSNDFIANYNLSFTASLNDKNLWQDYIGTEIQIITSPKIKGSNIIVNGEKKLQIGFTLSAIKLDLSKSEKFIKKLIIIYFTKLNVVFIIVKALVIAINAVIKAINKIIDKLEKLGIFKDVKRAKPIDLERVENPLKLFKQRFEERRSRIMLMENNFIQHPRLIALERPYNDPYVKANISLQNTNPKGSRVNLYNRNLLNAPFLWHKFHVINSFIEDDATSIRISGRNIQIANTWEKTNNQKKIYDIVNVPFCYEDYLKVKNSSEILDSDGITIAEVVSLKWNVYNQTADITYKVKSKYTDNLKITKIYSDGR